MKIEERSNGSSGRRRSGRGFAFKPLVAGVTTLALGFSGALLTAGAAQAAPGSSQATARYLSGTLLENSLDDLVAVAGEAAVANGSTEEVVTESGDLDLSVLGEVLNLQAADGVEIPLTLTDAGVLGQFAQASQSGESRGATGAITSDGIIDVDPGGAATGPLTLDLSQLIGDELATDVANLTLSTGVTSATAEQTGIEAPVGDYAISDLTASVTSPVLADLSDVVLTAGGDLETTVEGLLGPDGSLLDDLTGTLSLLGVVDADAAVALDLDPILTDILGANQILGTDGPVEIDLLAGAITVDIAAVLAANGRDLNDLAPGEDILTTELVGFITADVDELVNGLLEEVQEATAIALEAAVVTLDVTVGDPETPVLSLALDSSLGAISSGEAVSDIELLGIEFDTAILNTIITAAVDSALALELDTLALDGLLDELYPALDSVLLSLVRLQGNLQTTEAGVFTQTGLRLTALNSAPGEELLQLNIAEASVGPNALPTDEDLFGELSFTPTTGPEAGGTEVTFTGEGFDEVTEVFFGEVAATDFTVVSATELLATTPAGTGSVPVSLERGEVTQLAETPFVYTGATTPELTIPTVLTVTPAEGPEAGGTEITVIGTDFEGATSLLVGGELATDFTLVSPTEITAVTPPGVGLVDVTVNKGSEVSGVLDDAFTYIPETVGGEDGFITILQPAEGPEAGGTTVVIEGGNFTGATDVLFGDSSATEFTVVSDSEIVAVSPGGIGEVMVSIIGATEEPITSSNPFTYIPTDGTPPGETPGEEPGVITSITPAQGPEIGGTTVIIGGEGFDGATEVIFGDTPAADFTVISDTEISATTPAGTGTVAVVVTGADGEAITSPIGFIYLPEPVEIPGAPTIDAVTPDSGGTVGGTEVTIVGDGLDDAEGVFFGDNPAADFEVISDTEIRATTPAGEAGAVDVRVTDGSPVDGVLEDGFSYVTEITPAGNVDGAAVDNGGSATGGADDSGKTDRLARTGSEGGLGGILTAGFLLLAGAGMMLARRKGLLA